MTHAYADHQWFDFRERDTSSPLQWETPRDVTVHFILGIQAFPLTFKPAFPIPGGLDRPHPDLLNWTLRKMGLREGLARMLDLFEELDIAATLSIDADALPDIVAFQGRIAHPRHSLVAAGINRAQLHAGCTSPAEEATMIEESLSRLEHVYGPVIEGWHPPASAHSTQTLNVLASTRVNTIIDFNNDEHPFQVQTQHGTLLAIPYQHFASDLHCLLGCRQSTKDYFADISEAINWLQGEAPKWGSRLLTVPLHPWIIGAPHRFVEFEQALRTWHANTRVRFAGVREIKQAATNLW